MEQGREVHLLPIESQRHQPSMADELRGHGPPGRYTRARFDSSDQPAARRRQLSHFAQVRSYLGEPRSLFGLRGLGVHQEARGRRRALAGHGDAAHRAIRAALGRLERWTPLTGILTELERWR